MKLQLIYHSKYYNYLIYFYNYLIYFYNYLIYFYTTNLI